MQDTSIDDAPDTPGTLRARDSTLGRSNKNDPNTALLRAARMGNMDKVLELLAAGVDINTCNPSGLTALHLASKEGHMPVVAALLQRGANVNAVTGKGNTPLHIAALAGQEEVVRLLLHCDADVNARSQQGFTPLYMAAQENHVELCRVLLANGAKSNVTTDDGFSPLAVALQQGHEKVVALLLEQENKGKVKLPPLHVAAKKDDVNSARLLLQSNGSDDAATKISYMVNEPTKTGFTPLHIASHYGNSNVGAVLIEKGADVDFKGRNSITPLHVSAKWGRPSMVKLLLDNHATIEARTRDGLTALHCAARSGHAPVVEVMLQYGANSTAKTKNGLSPLHMAVQGNHEEVSRLLVDYKAPIDDVTVDYLTPLHVAAHCGNVETAKVLLENNCTVDSRALNGFTPLHIACKKFRIRIIELLLKFGANIEATTESGLTPLHVAAYMGHNQVILFLIQRGADPNAQTVRGETPLHLATRGNQVESMSILLRNGANVDAKANEMQTSLHIAARLGNVEAVKLLLSNGANVNAATKDDYTSLHIAAKEGYVDVVTALLDGGASTTLLTQNGLSPLHIAAKYGQTGVIKVLLERGADANIKGKNGLTPLHVAAHYNQSAAVDTLLKHKADPLKTAKNGYTPLHIAAKKNLIEVATIMLEHGAKPNVGSKSGFTPLHLAAQEGHKEMVALLLKHKADVNSNAKNGLTPMHLAAQEDHVPVAEVLVEYKAQIDPETKAGYTPLHTACHFAKINMINFLLRYGANINAKTKLGYTPLHMGAQQGHVLVVKVLLKNNANADELTSSEQTALSIAQQLGYVSVVEVLKSVTTVTATATDEKYKIVSPETMQETIDGDEDERPISGDFEDVDMAEAEEEHNKSYLHLQNEDVQYLHEDDMSPTKLDERDLNFSERMSTSGSVTPSMYLVRSSTLDRQDDEIVFSDVQDVQMAAAPMYASVPSLGSTGWLSDNMAFERQPINSGFLVSFMVDARGGAMRGCRHSGIRFIVPPCTAQSPTRITCKLVRKDKLSHPPPLMDGEALATRILEMGPPDAKFQGSIVIEVPHYASLRGKEREIMILRSDNGEHWYEHPLVATDDDVKHMISVNFEGQCCDERCKAFIDLEPAEEIYNRHVARIITNDLPRYFAVLTRIRQDVGSIGEKGGVISSTVVPQVQAIFPDGALTKTIRVGLQTYPVPAEVVAKHFAPNTAVGPIVTLEPRRRKFHKPINLSIPVPKKSGSGEKTNLRLLCSITSGSNAVQWEDITETTTPKIVNDVATFPTTVSARFWLVDTPASSRETVKKATGVYGECMVVPFLAKFVCFGRQSTEPEEGHLRVFCVTDDKLDKTLEGQQLFTEVARSKEIEVLDGQPQYIEMAGNLVPLTKSTEQLFITFHAFHENRLPITVRIKDPTAEPTGRIGFMKEPRGQTQQNPICTLTIALPGKVKEDVLSPTLTDEEFEDKLKSLRSAAKVNDAISKTDLRLTDVARELRGDWVPLARQLGFADDQIADIANEHFGNEEEQALVMLHDWVERDRPNATGNELEKALRQIGRPDVIRKCMKNLEGVTDDDEKQLARERLGIADDAPLPSQEEQDVTKSSESSDEDEERIGSKTAPVDENALIVPEVDDRRGVVKPLSPEELAKQQRDKDEAYDTFRDLLGEDLAEHNNPAGKRSAEDEEAIEEDSVSPVQAERPSTDEVDLDQLSTTPTKPHRALQHEAAVDDDAEAEQVDSEYPPANGSQPDDVIEVSDAPELESSPVTKGRTHVGAAETVDANSGADNDVDGESTLIGDVATDKAHVTVYTDTIEGKPETETQVEESEDTLPDGTLVKRRVTKTTEKQKLIKRIIVEGPEAELPKSGTEAEELLRQLGANPEVAAEFKPESGAEDGVPRVSTETEEFEETLADGSTVKKKIVRTTEEQFHTEHTVTDETLPDLTDAASASNRDGVTGEEEEAHSH